jgi:hypothetical protein
MEIIVANLDDEHKTLGSWDPKKTDMEGSEFTDLISGEEVAVTEFQGQHTCLLDPGRVLCLTSDRSDINLVSQADSQTDFLTERINRQFLRAKALDVLRFYKGTRDLKKFEPDMAAVQLAEDPVEYCRSLNPFSHESRVTTWQWPRDVKREVMVPPDHNMLKGRFSSFPVQKMQQ